MGFPQGPSNGIGYIYIYFFFGGGAKYLLSTYYNGTWVLWVQGLGFRGVQVYRASSLGFSFYLLRS